MGSISEKPMAQQHALEEAHAQYTADHSKSLAAHKEACNYLPGGNTRTVLHGTPFPLTIKSGQDTHLTTIDGHTYIDFLGEYTAGIYGHNHPTIKAAIEAALQNGWNYGGQNALEQKLAKIICDRFPSIELIRFVNSGTEANMMALATALAYTGKKKVLLFKKGYNGSTISGRGQSDKPSINLPHDFITGTYNDVEGTKELINSLPKDSLAAILVEPMLGSGGCYIGTPSFLTTLRNLATEHKALLIFDEVMTSRLHYHGLGSQTGVTSDLTTLGKYLGGGMTFGAFGGRREIMEWFDPRKGVLEHAGTFNNNIFTMHAGIAGCELLTRERIDALNALGDEMRQRIEAVLESHGLLAGCTVPTSPVLDDQHDAVHASRPPKMFIKGVGSLMAVHFAGPDQDALRGLFYHHLLQRGIYMAQRGFIALNIMLERGHVDAFVRAVEEFVQKWDKDLKW